MNVRIRVFRQEDHAAAWGVWAATEGLGLSSADSFESTARFLFSRTAEP